MTIENLDRVFEPGSVAVIGASDRPGSVGATVMHNLGSRKFQGTVLPVNPGRTSVMGIDACADVRDLPGDVDLAVVAVPILQVPEILETCVAKKVGGAVILSAGDTWPTPRQNAVFLQIKAMAGRSGMRILGPDSVGFIHTGIGLNASFMHQTPLQGRMAFLSQSGAVCTSVLDLAVRENVGFSHFVSLGSKLDVNFSDMLDYLGTLPDVDSIVMYVESVTRMRRFMSAARAVSRIKPIIALKSRRSGKISGPGDLDEDQMYDAAFKRAGILRVNEFEALFDCAEFLAKQQRPRGSRMAIVSNARGIGEMARDALVRHGLEPAALDSATIEKLDVLLSDGWSRANPIALLRAATPKQYVQVVKTCMQAPEIDGLLLLSSPVGIYDCTTIAKSLVDLLKTTPFPVFTAWLGGMTIDDSREIFNRHGIVTYDTPERAVRAFVNLYQYGRNMEALQQIPYTTDKRLKIDRDGAAQIIDDALARGKTHLPPQTAMDLAGAYDIHIKPLPAGVLPDYALNLSAKYTDLFGPVIRFGIGGLMTEVLSDMAVALPPLNRMLAGRTIKSTRISLLLQGRGHVASVDLDVLEEIMILMSRMVTDYPAIQTLTLNPIQIADGKIYISDIAVTVAFPAVCSPAHLIISPYPWWQESEFNTRDNERIFMRPVRPGDAQQMIDLFSDLSPETIFMRFFSPLKRISRPMLARLSQIDYDREIALCAFAGDGAARKLIGVARIIFMPDGKTGEFAVVVADDWHGKGIGSVLLKQAMISAKKYGLSMVSGLVLTNNAPMVAMGQKIGFSVARDPDSAEYRLTIELKDLV
ncbi:MAG: GNAT family N-acetyltransferase [Desulfotignum sp.]|nr:GNAT family N-acetyltransferase [Desulfotignum sp.]MCF8137448.1 GNAT family N-acetyltransferase [Desulfotignum sp.]